MLKNETSAINIQNTLGAFHGNRGILFTFEKIYTPGPIFLI